MSALPSTQAAVPASPVLPAAQPAPPGRDDGANGFDKALADAGRARQPAAERREQASAADGQDPQDRPAGEDGQDAPAGMEWLAQWAAYVPAAVPPGTSAAGLEPAADGEAADALLPSDPAASQPVDLASTDAAQAGPVQGAAPQPGLAAGITPPRGAGNAAKAVAARSDDVEPASRQPAPASERASAVPAAPAVPGAAQAAPAAEPRPAPGVLQDTATVPVNGIAHTHASSPRIDLPSAPGAPTPLQQGALQERIDGALRWMAAGNLQAAQLRVDPDALGPITIHLRLDGDIANVAFGSNHEATRQALESALPGLKDALQAGGLSLGQASVGSEQQGFSQARQFDEPAGRSARGASGDGAAAGHASAASSVEAQIPRRSGDRLLDAYA